MRAALTRISDEVFVASEPIVRLDSSAIELVRDAALASAKGRARICAHKSASDSLHEMVIGLTADTYVRPHRHPSKVESFHVIEGAGEVVILTDTGTIDDVVALGDGRAFYYRLDTPRFHTVLVRSPVLVIHEVTNGPFDRAETDFAWWAPDENDGVAAKAYMADLRDKADAWTRGA